MKNKIAIVHTTPLTVESLKNLVNKVIPGKQIINFVDDSILPQLAENGGNVEEVENRLIQYMIYAEEAGADIILNACSSVGEVVAKAQNKVTIPIVRIDEPMAEKAIISGNRVGVVATLSTTLNPTITLLKRKANEFNKEIDFQYKVAESAYQRLLNGDKEGHDEELKDILQQMAEKVDVVVLAQASMARVVASLPKELQTKFLSSPELGVQRLRETLEGIEH